VSTISQNSLSFALAPGVGGVRREDSLDLSTAPDYQLFFSCFLGDVRLHLDGLDFSTHFGWVTTLTFAMGFAAHVEALPQVRRSALNFREADEWISFLYVGDLSYVACSYTRGIAAVSHSELLRLSSHALSAHIRDLGEKYPALLRNPELQAVIERSPEAGDG
jgi:hypothetical protein